MGMMGGMMDGPSTTVSVTLATLIVSGQRTTSPALPAMLPAPPAPNGSVARQRQVTFAMGMGMGGRAWTG